MPDQYRYNPLTGQMDLVGDGGEAGDLAARVAALETELASLPFLNWEYLQTTTDWETLEDVTE